MRHIIKVPVIILFLIFSLPAFAQNKFTFSGSVKDKKTGEMLIGATVKVADKSSIGTVTNEYGFFSLTLPAGNYKISINYLGYTEETVTVDLLKSITKDVALVPSKNELKEVVVSGNKTNNIKSAQMGVEKLSIKDINAVPVLFGEKDVMKTIQLLPGVKPAGEGNSGFYVRGGAIDQNLIILDEAIVYNPSHLLGFFSTFNSDAIKDVTLYKGGMPSQYGGRLSSVLDVKMNEGNDQEYHVSGGIGLISSKVNIEGPIVKDEGSFLISARRTYADMFLKLSSDTVLNKSRLYFYDLNTKLNYKITNKDRLFLSGYFGQDDLGIGSFFGINWGNATGTLRWNHIINDKLFSNTSLIFSDYSYDINVNTGTAFNIHSEIRDWNLKEELELFANPNNSIRFGISSIYHTITPGQITGSGITNSTQPDNHTWENAIYATNSWKAGDKLNIDYGLRLSAFSVMGGTNLYNLDASGNILDTLHYGSGQIVQTYYIPEPRISASYLLNDISSVKLGYARNSQYLHLISNSNTSNPTDKWVATNNIIKPEVSDQVSTGYFRSIKDEHYEFSVETYYKFMQNEIDYRDNANIISNAAIEPELLFGQGRAYGAEFMLRKKVGKLTGWAAYTLSRTEIQINGINNNKWYPARQDRTHDIALVGIYELSPKWTLSADFVFYTGNAVTYPSGKYSIGNQVQNYYTERNGYRFPNYQRLDFSATQKLKPHKHYTSELNFSLYNVYGYQNAYIIQFKTDPNYPNRSEAVQTSLFRWVPSIAYNFKF